MVSSGFESGSCEIATLPILKCSIPVCFVGSQCFYIWLHLLSQDCTVLHRVHICTHELCVLSCVLFLVAPWSWRKCFISSCTAPAVYCWTFLTWESILFNIGLDYDDILWGFSRKSLWPEVLPGHISHQKQQGKKSGQNKTLYRYKKAQFSLNAEASFLMLLTTICVTSP